MLRATPRRKQSTESVTFAGLCVYRMIFSPRLCVRGSSGWSPLLISDLFNLTTRWIYSRKAVFYLEVQHPRVVIVKDQDGKDVALMGRVYSHLGEEERQGIQAFLGQGVSYREIGKQLHRSASTISREIKRNTWFPSNHDEAYRPYRPAGLKTGAWTGTYYVSGQAHRKTQQRAHLPRKPSRFSSDELTRFVCGSLRRGWSPVLISGRLKLEYPHNPPPHESLPGNYLHVGLLQ